MTSDTSGGDTSGGNTSGSHHEAAFGQRMTQVARWVRGRGASGRLLARRSLRRVGPKLALGVVLLSGLLGQLAAGIGTVPVAHAAASSQGGKNTFHASNDLGGKAVYLPGQVKTVKTLPPRDASFRPAPVSMKPADMVLSPTAAAHLLGSDKRLEVTVPEGAVTSALLTQAGGALHLHVEELEGPSGGTDSGHVSLGTYAFTLMNAAGKKVAASLARPITLTLHLDGWRGAAFDLSHVTLLVNVGVPLSVFAGPDGTVPTKVTPSYVPATLDQSAQTLTAQMPLTGSGGGSSTGTWNTESPEAQWSKQADTSVDLSGGNLTYSYPIDVPAGQGGLTPKLTLSYDSAAVTGNHNPQGTSGWLGEGWDLAVGSISWGEHNVTSSCSSTCGNTWEDSWQFSDAYGNGGELIPPNSNMTAWYDDTTFGLTSEPINAWHLDNSGDIRVISYTNPGCNDPNSGTCAAWQRRFPLSSYKTLPPCFRAFLPDGTIEEFGCTLDSIQFFVNESAGANQGANYVYRWDLDAIIDASGNQIQFWYNQVTNWDKVGNWKFPIDAELAGAAYDASACHNRSALCTGSSWNPAVQVLFQTAYAPARLAGAACPTWTDTTTYNTSQTMRCDDVQDLSGSGGDAAPTLQSLVVLNDVLVQVTTTPSAPSWQTLRDYQMTYEQGASTSSYNGAPVIDATTGVAESVAGYTDLTQIAEVGDDSRLSLPPLTMSYTTLDEYYVDAMNPYAAPAPAGGGNCGPAFNHPNCKLWAQSYNARYLSTLDNGEGWHEAYTWQLARNNTHGVNSGLMLENPLACTAASPSVQQTYPCDEADDENWSRVVLTQRQASVLCVAADGSGCGSAQTTTLTSTWTYAYLLTDAVAKECSDCTEDMYWGDNSDGDKLDFYDAHFMGFAAANVTNPDGSVTSETFYSTMGYGEATSSIQCKSFSGICDVDPWTDPRNALHGRLKEEDDYDTDHTTLLKQTIEQFSVMCPAPGVAASAYNTDPTQSYVGQNTSELDPYDPVTVCAVEPAQEDVYAVDGGAPLTGPHATTTDTYSYDSAGHLTQSTQNVTANDAGPGSASTILTRTQDAWNDAISTTTTSASGTYVAEVPGITTTEDGAGNVKACAYAAYDGGAAGATGQQGSLVAGLATRTDRYATSCTPGSLAGQVSGTRTYDASGNLLGVEDADALAGIGGHSDATDCTIGGTAYSACASYDGLYDALPVATYNALGQKTTLNYTTDGSNPNSPDASNGWGTWLTSGTDANNAVTAYGYDALGRLTKLAKPGDTLSSPTTSYQYVDTCATTGAQEPCVGLLTTQQLSSGVTVTDATYYDGWGRPVETLTPQAYENGACTYSVRYTAYDTSGRTSFTSEAYFASVTQATCTPSGYLRPAVDNNHLGTSVQYDGLGRVTLTQDALQQPTTTKYTQTRLLAGANLTDTNWYSGQLVTDANGHQVITLKDGLGRTRYTETQTGTSASGYALYGTSAQSYDWLGDVTSVMGPNPPPGAAGLSTSPQTTTSYDLLGRTTGMSDADLGTGWSDNYDPDGNLLESVDARGAAGTTYTGYDGLNRPVWRNTSNSASGAYVTYSYDAGMAGSFGTGRLTAEVFRGSGSGTGGTGGTSLSGAYTYRYDALGRTIRTDQTMGGAGACPTGWTCQDIGYTSPAGGQSAAGDGLWTLQASGSDVYGTSDGLHLVSQPLSGDGAITAHFDSQTVTGTYTKMGVMLRSSNAANAAEYNLQVDANGLYYVAVRSSSGGSTTNLAQGNLTGPVWLKVARSGSSYSAYTSTDGQHWTYVPSSTITLSLGASVLAGVFASANNASAVSLATLDSVSVTTGGTGACPSGWSCEDIGYTSPAGGQTAFGDGLWTLQASGGDVYGTSDELHLVSQPLSGDGGISAHFDSQTATGTYAKMGVMLRGSDAVNAAEYNLQVDANGQFYVAYRATAGGSTSNLTQGTLTGPVWLKVARSGSSYTAYTSSDGTTWTAVPNSTITLNLGASVLAGVFACANTTSTTTTATLDSVSPAWADPSSLTTATPSPPSGVSSYVTTQSYDDAGAPTNTVYPDGEMVATSYTPQEWLAGLSTTQGGTATTLLSNVSYSGAGGAAQEMTGATLANGVYTEALSYDAMARPTESSITRLSDGALLFDSKRAYDAVGNVANVWTTLPTGTDYQAFCYDEQNRLVWASSQSGTVPCDGDPTWTAGTLSGATYTKTYSYDTLNRLTSGPGGSYTYGDSAHLDAATAITGSSSGYTASYDAAGDMACRAPTSATTCTGGSPTGAQMSYDNERRLASWQNAPGNTPTSSTSNLYDGEGHRVEQQVTNGAATTTVTYVGAIEELSTTAGVTTTTTSYYAGGQRIAQAVNGAFGYLGSDGLGSAEVALDGSGNPQASALYDPYGNVRYTSGTMPGSYGYTGQRADAATGLDDFNARYYDPTLGQFTSADTVGDGLNRYAYVADDPETGTDPSGHCWLVCAVIAAVATAVVATAVDAVVQQVTTGQVDWGTALKTGATAGLMVGAAIALGPAAAAVEGTIAGGLGGGAVASVAAAAAVGAGEGAAFQVGDNVVNGRDWRAGVGQAALIGGVSAGVLSGAGELLGSAGDDAGAFCGLSFAPETPVATPNGGEQAISSLHVGDAVEAYDPTTGTTSAQHVQQLFVNHDTDLLDVTLRTSVPHAKRAAPPANPSMSGHVQQNLPAQQHGQQSASHDTSTTQATETVHTTANHPWLTADHGWEQAGVLRVGEPVVTADGDAAVVVALRVVAGTAAMWDLTVSNVHDFAVGSGEYIVHNCDGEIDPNEVRFTQNSAAQRFRNGRSVFGTIDDLRSGALSPDDVDPIRIFRKESWMDNLNAGRGSGSNLEDGQLYSLDNRRLYAFQQAGMTRIRFVWATTDEIVGNVDHFTTENWGTSIRIRGIN